jgi:hypothetical protein
VGIAAVSLIPESTSDDLDTGRKIDVKTLMRGYAIWEKT